MRLGAGRKENRVPSKKKDPAKKKTEEIRDSLPELGKKRKSSGFFKGERGELSRGTAQKLRRERKKKVKTKEQCKKKKKKTKRKNRERGQRRSKKRSVQFWGELNPDRKEREFQFSETKKFKEKKHFKGKEKGRKRGHKPKGEVTL